MVVRKKNGVIQVKFKEARPLMTKFSITIYKMKQKINKYLTLFCLRSCQCSGWIRFWSLSHVFDVCVWESFAEIYNLELNLQSLEKCVDI